MKVVLFAGGLGSRLAEETTRIPKPMVEIGGKPIILHVMDIYSHWGHRDFVVAGGYKCMSIKSFFHNFHLSTADFTVALGSGSMVLHPNHPLDWNVSVVDTGLSTMTGGRLLRLRGVRVAGAVRKGPVPGGARLLHVAESEPLGETVRRQSRREPGRCGSAAKRHKTVRRRSEN